MSDLGRIAVELRRTALLSNPRRLCEKLGLLDGAKRQSGDGVLIRCPVHQERTPSCSVTRGPDGTTRCRCFSCDWTGDALTLIQVVGGNRPMSEVIEDACAMVGMVREFHDQASETRATPRRMPQDALSMPEATQPSFPAEATALWASLAPLRESPAACSMLRGRSIDPTAVGQRDLARVILEHALPRWASYQGESWAVTGHVLVLPVFDSNGELRSVRAWRVIPGDSPKRLPPGGHKATGLVLANAPALVLLRGKSGPCRVIVVEGESDFLVWATRSEDAVIGVLSGAWTEEHAAKIPLGSAVILRTDRDPAGDKYAERVAKTVAGRCHVRRAG